MPQNKGPFYMTTKRLPILQANRISVILTR